MKRKIKSNLVGQLKPQFFRAVLAVAFGVILAIGLAGAEAQGVEVYPTGDPAIDVPTVQAAVDLGGTVILKAGTFNFGTAGGADGKYVEINNDVIIMGEAGSIIYGGGAGNDSSEGAQDLRGAFTVMSGNVSISNLHFEDPYYAGIFVLGCNGVNISNNVITNPQPAQSIATPWRSRAKGIAVGEWITDQVFGDVLVQNNTITHDYVPPYQVRWGEGISIIYIASNPLPNISIIGNTVNIVNPGRERIYMSTGVMCWSPHLVKNNTITGSGHLNRGIYSESFDPHTSEPVNGTVIEGNTLTANGYCWRGITAAWGLDMEVINNNVSGYFGKALEAWRAINSIITGNTISGSGDTGIANLLSDYSIITQNTIESFRSTIIWGAPIIVERSSNCTVIENTLIDVFDPVNYAEGNGPIAGIRISGWMTLENPCDNNNLLGNYFRQSGLPGLTAQSDGPFCVILEEGTKNNFVKEQGGYPLGTNAKTQVFDGGYYDEYGNWTTTNRVVGHDANQLAQHEELNPGIGQRLKVISDASGETEEE